MYALDYAPGIMDKNGLMFGLFRMSKLIDFGHLALGVSLTKIPLFLLSVDSQCCCECSGRVQRFPALLCLSVST